MTYRQLKPKRIQKQEPTENELTEEQVAAYIRQSSTHQVEENIESADLQLSGAQRYAISEGLDAKKIVVAHEGKGKRGVSGTLRIDQRDDLRDIMAGIIDGTIKRVWAYSVSRLFRDKYGTQVATFIEACAEHNVKVVIHNTKTFDFTESFDIMLFRLLADVAARENEDRVNLLRESRANKAMRGQYHGRPLQPGYIIDRVKDSPTYGRYIPYWPHAKIAARLYGRFRELGGQFNLLVAEAGKMPVIFPPFEEWVDKRNISQFKLRKVCKAHGWQCDCKQADCELMGYHMTRKALFHLLTAVEYAGYWKFGGEVLTDAEGQPIKNHEAIVPMDDWLYAFNHLSFTTLTGEENTERASTRTWISVKKDGPTTLLEGILTSPLGTVFVTGGAYRVAERRHGTQMTRPVTLQVPALWIDAPFRFRLKQRVYEDLAGNKNFLYEQLKRIKTNNAEALVSVDEQIANYRKAIANREAYIAAVGASIEKETALSLNAAMIEDRAHLAALLAKKNEANKEVSGIEELVDRIGKLAAKPGKRTFKTKRGEFPTRTGEGFFIEGDEDMQRFIRLATESVELNEYSGHVLTLTIRWRAPFTQTDVCYIYRHNAGHQEWSKEDEQALRDLYPLADKLEIIQALPTRSWQSIGARAKDLGLKRNTYLNTSGVHDTRLCWLDAQLLQAHGWQTNEEAEHTAWWTIDVLGTGF